MRHSADILPKERTRFFAFLTDLAIAGMGGAGVYWSLKLQAQGIGELVVIAYSYAAYWLASSWYSPAQSIGKRFVGIVLVTQQGAEAGRNVALARAVVRTVAPLVLGAVAGSMGGSVERYTALFFVASLLADAYCVSYRPGRRTIADYMSKTMVVVLPPVQPHRAPAGPMFSATDREFGLQPREDEKDVR